MIRNRKRPRKVKDHQIITPPVEKPEIVVGSIVERDGPSYAEVLHRDDDCLIVREIDSTCSFGTPGGKFVDIIEDVDLFAVPPRTKRAWAEVETKIAKAIVEVVRDREKRLERLSPKPPPLAVDLSPLARRLIRAALSLLPIMREVEDLMGHRDGSADDIEEIYEWLRDAYDRLMLEVGDAHREMGWKAEKPVKPEGGDA